MYDKQSLSHTMWDCKYHLVWIPKYRKKVIYGELRKYLGEIFRELARQKRMRSNRRASYGGPCPHIAFDSSQIRGISGRGFYQRQKCYSDCPEFPRPDKEFCGPALLGQRILCINSWQRRKDSERIYPTSRARR
jgi:putative transposase